MDLDALKGIAATEADASDRLGAMSSAMLDAFRAADLFRLWVPRDVGGGELDLPASMELFEEIGGADGSTGWIAAIGVGGGLFGGVMAKEVAAEVFASPRDVIAGSGMPRGAAEPVENGYRVAGRWPYASGCTHATWFTGNCILVGPSGGEPRVRAMAFPRDQVEIIETWDVEGMRATASHDFEVRGQSVPGRYSFSVFEDEPWCTGPLYRFPFMAIAALSFASVGVGIARHALAEFAALARTKTPSGETGPLAGLPGIGVRVAEAESLVSSSRAFLYETASQSWEVVAGGGALDQRGQARAQLAASHAVSASARATGLLYEASGMNVVFRPSALGRCWRDLRVLSQNAAVSTLRLESAGRALLDSTPSN